ncbi:MAG: phosphoribosylglycinamide formyltransferase [Verrucomicrobiota bacterium]
MSPFSNFDDARAWRDQLDRAGKRVVFTNGCFDLLHVGHVRYLAEARALGHALVVAVNSDTSVRELKGPDRPIHSEEDRGEILAALKAVDQVVLFDSPRATAAIRAIAPHIYAKGGDYTPETLNPEEAGALSEAGSEIRILSLVDGQSTTNTLARMKPKSGRKPRLAILGSGHGSTLEGLYTAIESGQLEAEIVLVLSDQPEARILSVARSHGTEAVAITTTSGSFSPAAHQECVDRLRAAGTDLLILAGFMRLIREPLLTTFPDRILNVHPSLLPKYPGLGAWEQALVAGDTETGCTVHLVDSGLDTGPILGRKTVPVLPEDTPRTLHRRIQAAERELYPEMIQNYACRLGFYPQE